MKTVHIRHTTAHGRHLCVKWDEEHGLMYDAGEGWTVGSGERVTICEIEPRSTECPIVAAAWKRGDEMLSEVRAERKP